MSDEAATASHGPPEASISSDATHCIAANISMQAMASEPMNTASGTTPPVVADQVSPHFNAAPNTKHYTTRAHILHAVFIFFAPFDNTAAQRCRAKQQQTAHLCDTALHTLFLFLRFFSMLNDAPQLIVVLLLKMFGNKARKVSLRSATLRRLLDFLDLKKIVDCPYGRAESDTPDTTQCTTELFYCLYLCSL